MAAGFHLILLVTLAAAPDSSGRPAVSDSLPPRRVVRTLETFTVRGAALHDPLSTQSVHLVSRGAIQRMPVDRIADLVALQAGVVARGEDLHVRGGRAGELNTELEGLSLNEPIRGRALEVPLLALREVELATGGLDADLGGGMGGTLVLRTVDPGERWEREIRWQTDARRGTHYDRVGARAGGPIGSRFGAVATLEATLDDTHLPALRNNGRARLLGTTWGWRADNRLLGHAKLVARTGGSRFALETLANRRVSESYDPMWSLDGWVSLCPDPDTCLRGPAYSSNPKDGWNYYHAADHQVMTDERGLLTILSWSQLAERRRLSASLSWAHDRSVTSLDGRDDESYIGQLHTQLFGPGEELGGEPFLVHWGDEQYFRRTTSDRVALLAQWRSFTPRGDQVKLGAGLLHESVALRELDLTTFGFRADSLRSYRTQAPGGFAYAHGRWVFEGMAANAGMRLEYWTPGSDAPSQSFGVPKRGVLTFSPRLGIAYPLSVRDVFSLSYVRVSQNPYRDYLYDDRLTVTNRRPIGNPAIGPATLISYQAAVKHQFGPRWSLQTALFYRDAYGMIGARNTRPEVQIPQMVYQDREGAHALGYELTVVCADGEKNRVEVQYTYLDALGTYSREEGTPFGPRLGALVESLGEHPLDWDRRHSLSLTWQWQAADWSLSMVNALGSPLPWTPSDRRQNDPDLTRVNSQRMGWEESSALALRYRLPVASRRFTLGLDVQNLLDRHDELATTADGYPNPVINTVYDDYGAYRHETGNPGGAYWDDRDGDGFPGWKPVRDPRLFSAPRAARVFVGAAW